LTAPSLIPIKAARRLSEHAHAFEPVQDGRIYIEKINGPFLFGDKGTPAEYRAGPRPGRIRARLARKCMIAETFVKLTQGGRGPVRLTLNIAPVTTVMRQSNSFHEIQ